MGRLAGGVGGPGFVAEGASDEGEAELDDDDGSGEGWEVYPRWHLISSRVSGGEEWHVCLSRAGVRFSGVSNVSRRDTVAGEKECCVEEEADLSLL